MEIKDERDNPIDITGHVVEFTVKKVRTDFDRHDDFAYIAKEFLPQDPVNGRFYILLSSDDTDFEPGKFFFDIELVHQENGMVYRLVTCEFTLEGGPTNRRVNKGMGQWPTGDRITVITLAEGPHITVIAPTMNLDGDVLGQVAVIMEAVKNMESHIEDCDALVATLREEVNTLTATVDQHDNTLGEHQLRLDSIEEAIDDIQKTLASLETADETLLEAIRDQGLEITALQKTQKAQDVLLEKYERFFKIVADQLNITSLLT